MAKELKIGTAEEREALAEQALTDEDIVDALAQPGQFRLDCGEFGLHFAEIAEHLHIVAHRAVSTPSIHAARA